MESEEIRELRATLLKLKQEHRDLDSAINALEESGRADQLQLKRLKKKKLLQRKKRPLKKRTKSLLPNLQVQLLRNQLLKRNKDLTFTRATCHGR